MEKISIGGRMFDLAPNGIVTTDKKRSFTFISDLPSEDIEAICSDLPRIDYLSESGEILKTYYDCIDLKAISRDLENGTYTITVGIDAVERRFMDIQNSADSAICELTLILSMIMGGF